ncbi:hypothetical protein DYB30_010022 [Aphanomyces astaci]|uniref:Uncharacterized protein n=1 Tax=Aphanomyces astaci TaxID=112090 RepID=A0A397DIL3_APHAT|nr:hypothetical protein DYB30_010022 [Aphanomyces astaci]
MAFVDAYEQTGWRQRSSEKLKPTAELVAVRQKLARHQRALLRELAEFDAVFAMDTPLPTHASELAHDDDIVCSKCQSTLTSDGNDIVLCDCGTCHRYVFPELTAHDLEGDTNEMSSDARQTQQDMDEDKASDEDFDKVGADCLWDDDDDDEEEEMAEERDALSDAEVQFLTTTTDVLDAARRSMRSHHMSHDDQSDEDVTTLIVSGKRRRTAVDYRKLHGEMFPNAKPEDDDDDDKDEYVPPQHDDEA